MSRAFEEWRRLVEEAAGGRLRHTLLVECPIAGPAVAPAPASAFPVPGERSSLRETIEPHLGWLSAALGRIPHVVLVTDPAEAVIAIHRSKGPGSLPGDSPPIEDAWG